MRILSHHVESKYIYSLSPKRFSLRQMRSFKHLHRGYVSCLSRHQCISHYKRPYSEIHLLCWKRDQISDLSQIMANMIQITRREARVENLTLITNK